MRKFAIATLVLSLALGLGAVMAQADPIAVNSGWQVFLFQGQNSAWYAPSSFEFTLSSSGILKVTDVLQTGDQFSVYNFGAFLGNTTFVPVDSSFNTSPDFCFADSHWSHGTFLLSPGSYSISGYAIESPWGYGGGYVQVNTPLPASVLLLGSGLLGLAGLRRKFKG
jgi:hypothetical protein